MLKINKIVSETALPLTKQNNLINFIVPQEGSHLDIKDSYVQFTMDVTSDLSARLSLGQDGFPYHPVALIRRARLVSSTKGVIQETNNLNILMENLLWNGRTSAEDQSDALTGWGAVPATDYMHSTFTDYSGTNCVVRIPMEHLFPGSIGKFRDLPNSELGQLTVMLELEPTKNLFQQAVLPRWAGQDKYDLGNYTHSIAFDDLTEASDVLTADGVDLALLMTVGSQLRVTYVADGETNITDVTVIITAVDGDTVTVSQEIPISSDITAFIDNLLVHCATISGGTGATGPAVASLSVPVDTTDGQQFTGEIPDLTYGHLPLQAEVSWAYYPIAGGGLTGATSQQVTITGVTGSGPWTVAVSPSLPAVPSGQIMGGIDIKPLAVNINDAVWTVNQAYAFVYHKMGKPEGKSDKMAITTFTYEPLPLVSDGYSFSREVQVSGNAFDCFLMTPPSTNTSQLISVAQGVKDYRFFLDDVALSTIPLQIDGVTHLDMLMRVFNNSDFPLRNLSFYKDSPWFVNRTGSSPATQVAKMKPKSIMGMDNIEEGAPRRNLRVEMNGEGMPANKTIYFFKNEWKMI